jgi:hypothetical protein
MTMYFVEAQAKTRRNSVPKGLTVAIPHPYMNGEDGSNTIVA